MKAGKRSLLLSEMVTEAIDDPDGVLVNNMSSGGPLLSLLVSTVVAAPCVVRDSSSSLLR